MLPNGTTPAPFLAALPLDPTTNTPFVQGIDAQGTFFIETLGSDGIPGGAVGDGEVRMVSDRRPPAPANAAPPVPNAGAGEE